MNELLLSLCIPTNGISEWVFPVLDSIYEQANSLQKFEVVVTDNGNNLDFYNRMQEYCSRYQNLCYEKTKAHPHMPLLISLPTCTIPTSTPASRICVRFSRVKL